MDGVVVGCDAGAVVGGVGNPIVEGAAALGAGDTAAPDSLAVLGKENAGRGAAVSLEDIGACEVAAGVPVGPGGSKERLGVGGAGVDCWAAGVIGCPNMLVAGVVLGCVNIDVVGGWLMPGAVSLD